MMRCMYFSIYHLLCKSATIYDISTSDFYRKLLTIIIIVNRSSNKL